MAETQKQSSGDNSVNLQADKIILGASFGEIREIAQTVFEANFYKLANIAADTATQRAKEFTESFLQQLAQRQPKGSESANDPDFQYSLFTAQKEYARSGEKDLGEILADILVDRAAENGKTIKQIVLNESINTAPKLTSLHWDALAIVFLQKYVGFPWVSHISHIPILISKYYLPFISNLPTKQTCCQHMEYAGCGTVSIGSTAIEFVWKLNFGGLFQKGFSEEELKSVLPEGIDLSQLLVKCDRDANKLQFNILNVEKLREQLKQRGVSDQKTEQIIGFYNAHLVSDGELKDYLISIDPLMAKLFENWDKSGISHFTLTSVGIAIAHANVRRRTGMSADLGIWIN
jgi:hypothetical protein